MKKLLTVFGLAMAVVASPANAQTITENGGTVTFSVAEQSYKICQNNQLNEQAYAEILRAYTANAVQNDLTPKYMEVYAAQNERLDGQLDKVLQQQQSTMTQAQMDALYTPFKDQLSKDQFFKLHILNATSISTLLAQELGPQNVQKLCSAA